MYRLWSLILLMGCGDFFGKKTRLDFIEVPQYDDALVAYIPILPDWTGFSAPTDVIVGWDELIYVADSGAGKIVCLDQAGRRLGEYPLPGVSSLAQKRNLDLIAVARAETLIGNRLYRLPALYFLRLTGAEGYGLRYATLYKKIVHPYDYLRSSVFDSDTAVRFGKIALFSDNSYLVARRGISNDPFQFGGPDNTILRFDSRDAYEGYIVVETQLGEDPTFFQNPVGLCSYACPPQRPTVSTRKDFWVGMVTRSLPILVQSIRPQESEQGTSYQPRNDFAIGDTAKAEGFLITPYRFSAPVGLRVSEDGQYLFVADPVKDSVYVFTTLQGYEGVKPPPAAQSNRLIKISFGGPGQLSEPVAVAHFNKTLYVCERTGRIRRFRLTTDL
ncbi:MAG: hypothetical protein ACUVRD_07035 [Bacteroidia bacterium]